MPRALADWWTRFQEADEAEREAMLRPDEAPQEAAPLPRTRTQAPRRRRGPECLRQRARRRASLGGRAAGTCDPGADGPSRLPTLPAMALAFIGLGSNLAHPRRRIARALGDLARVPGTRLVAVSPSYVSAPVGSTIAQPDYVNAVALVATRLRPRALLARLAGVERRHGRRRIDARAQRAPEARSRSATIRPPQDGDARPRAAPPANARALLRARAARRPRAWGTHSRPRRRAASSAAASPVSASPAPAATRAASTAREPALSRRSHGTRALPLRRRRGTDRGRQDQPRPGDRPPPRAPTRSSSCPRRTRSSPASTRTWRATRCRRSSTSCSSGSTSCAASRSSTCSRARPSPTSSSTRTRCSRASTSTTTSSRSTRRSTRT